MYYYLYKNKLIISKAQYDNQNFQSVNEDFCKSYVDTIFIMNPLNCSESRKTFVVSNENLLFLNVEDLTLLKSPTLTVKDIPSWLKTAINERKVISLNTNFPNWEDALSYVKPTKWKINLVGLGDVGGTLLTGLKLLGYENISSLGIFDLDTNKINRWHLELSQILSCDGKEHKISINILEEKDLFDCDLFIFSVSIGVPQIGKEHTDVRLIQFKGNSKIISYYGKLARAKKFKGIFAVVSDPVDLLCKSLYMESNKDNDGILDFKGLTPEQIRGYGLGVMNGRASYYASLKKETLHYLTEGRAFGPHGEGLIIADSVYNYNVQVSDYLTEKAKNANLEVRSTGFKPYIAPALSSGTLSLLDTIRGNWHYSATFIGGTFMGCRNRFINGTTELETLPLNSKLFDKLSQTYSLLNNMFNTEQS